MHACNTLNLKKKRKKKTKVYNYNTVCDIGTLKGLVQVLAWLNFALQFLLEKCRV